MYLEEEVGPSDTWPRQPLLSGSSPLSRRVDLVNCPGLLVLCWEYTRILSLSPSLCHKGLKTLNTVQTSDVSMSSNDYQNYLGGDMEIK